jgi:D-alanyl-D-alanine carboxypeptidase/D-alanyl-D-alanine-endopeptidase (penicillin-binding protein 4)
MFYQVAAATGAVRPGAKQARQVVDRLVSWLGLNPDAYRIADGSGLSLYNYLSPALEVALLQHAWRKPSIYKHLLPSLPIAGVDGTLKKRMKATAAEGNVQAKTGTVTGVSCLAGYCTAPNGHRLCFSIMNQGTLSISQSRRFQDLVCEAMCAPQ